MARCEGACYRLLDPDHWRAADVCHAMEAHHVKRLIGAMAACDLAQLHAERDGWSLRLIRHKTFGPPTVQDPRCSPEMLPAAPTPSKRQPVDNAVASHINAPFGGIVHLSSAPGAPALAPAGSFVEVNATVCLIEAMKVFVEVRAERAGIVEAVLVQSGDEVDAGKPLLRIG